MPLDGSGEHGGPPRENKWTDFDVAFMEIQGSSPHSVDTSQKVVTFESTKKTSTETFVTGVNSGLTAQHLQISDSDAHEAIIWPRAQQKIYIEVSHLSNGDLHTSLW
jgi:hypothetical protein